MFAIVYFAFVASVFIRDATSNGLLISAIEENDEPRVKSLIENGENVNYRMSCELCVEYMPLHLAAKRGNAKIVELLIKNGAEVDGISELSKGFHGDIPQHKETPLIIAAKNGHVDVVKMLIKAGANVNHENHSHENALLVASEKGYDQIVKTLIENGANVNGNSSGNSPLNNAAEFDYFRVAELLINAGADIDAQDGAGYTHLNTAALRGKNIEVAKLLIEKGADLNIKTNGNEYTPLLWSTHKGRDELSLLLIEKGADVNIADKAGDSPLINAVQDGSVKVVDSLIKHGANVNYKDNDNKTALDYVKKETIKELLLKAAATKTNEH